MVVRKANKRTTLLVLDVVKFNSPCSNFTTVNFFRNKFHTTSIFTCFQFFLYGFDILPKQISSLAYFWPLFGLRFKIL